MPSPAPTHELVRKGRYDTILGGAGDSTIVSFQIIWRLFFHAIFGFVSCTESRLAHVRTPQTCRGRGEFLRLEISNFNTRSNLIALGEYRGSQLKPDHHSPADAVGRFRTTWWIVALRSAQIGAEGRLGP
jgi:hypothetical protein